MFSSMTITASRWHVAILLPIILVLAYPALAQTKPRLDSIHVDGTNVRVDVQSDLNSPTQPSRSAPLGTNALFPVAPTSLEKNSVAPTDSTILRPTNSVKIPPKVAASSRPLVQNQSSPTEEPLTEFAVAPLVLRATNIQPSENPKIRWLLFQSSERSANTGQLTCLGWARSINLANALESEGPFNAVVASASVRDDLSIGTFWNNAAEATVVPLASKWDAPVWAQAPAESPLPALSALYQFSKNAKGSANIAVSWDAEYLERFQASWFEGLVESGDIEGLQAFSWKQKIRKWNANDKSRVDVLEYAVERGKIKNVVWRTMNLRIGNLNYGCPTS